MTFGEKLSDGKVVLIATGSKTNCPVEDVRLEDYLIIANPETPGEIIETIVSNIGNYDTVEVKELKTKFAVFRIDKTIIK